MAEGDGPAVGVDLVDQVVVADAVDLRPTHDHAGKGLVDLHHIHIVQRHLSHVEHLFGRRDGTVQMEIGV